MPETNTQLTSVNGYNTDRMLFSDPVTGTIPESKPPITYQRINIQTENEDGTVGDLIFSTEELFSFGVAENENPETKKVNGYVMPLCLTNRDGPTKGEKAFVDTFNNVVEKCKDWLIDNKEEIGQLELERTDLKKFNPLYLKKEKYVGADGKTTLRVVPGSPPMLYAKLIVSKKHDKIVTAFYDYDGNPLNAIDLLGKYCHTRAAIKIESIFIGNKLSLQIKLYEAEVRISESGMKRLLTARPTDSRVMTKKTTAAPIGGDDDEDDEGSLNGEEAEPTPPPVARKVVKRKVVRKVPVASE